MRKECTWVWYGWGNTCTHANKQNTFSLFSFNHHEMNRVFILRYTEDSSSRQSKPLPSSHCNDKYVQLHQDLKMLAGLGPEFSAKATKPSHEQLSLSGMGATYRYQCITNRTQPFPPPHQMHTYTLPLWYYYYFF